MNLITITGKIVNQPKLLRYKKKTLTKIVVCIPNNKKGVAFYNITCNAKGKLGNEVFEIYRKGDFVIIEGFISINSQKININNKYMKTVKSINIKINRIHPVSLIFT